VSRVFCGLGTVYSYSVVRSAPNGFVEQVPYVVALVRLVEGPLVAAQLTDVAPDGVAMGMAVQMVTRRLRVDGRLGLVHYAYKFRPVLADAIVSGDPSVSL
jgi:uncharacterized OB-fold protein